MDSLQLNSCNVANFVAKTGDVLVIVFLVTNVIMGTVDFIARNSTLETSRRLCYLEWTLKLVHTEEDTVTTPRKQG